MKKRIFTLMLALFLVLAMMPVPAFAEGEVTEPPTETVAPEETKKPVEPAAPEETKKPEEPLAPAEPTATQKVQTLIDALPEVITAENRAEVESQLAAIDTARCSLGDEEQAALRMARYNAAVAALNVLDDQPGAEAPKTMEAEPLTVTMADWNVSATPNQPAVTGLPDTPDAYEVTYYKRGASLPLPAVPTEVGQYTVTVSCVDERNNAYFGSADFSIFLSVSFDPNGGTLPEADYTIQTTTGKLSTLPEPAWTGHSFRGWFTEKAEGYRVETDTVYYGNTTLYARWKTHTYTISFDANGGEGEMDPLPMTCGQTANLTGNGFTRDGYRFTGWNTQADGRGSASFADEAPVSDLSTVDGGMVTLYAQWVQILDGLELTLSGHGLDKKVEGIRVDPGKGGEGILFNGSDYGGDYSVAMEPDGKTLSSELFRADLQYCLRLTFRVRKGYIGQLDPSNVAVNGRHPQSMTVTELENPQDPEGNGQIYEAVFALPVIYTIEASAGKNGTIDPEGTVAVFEGQDVEIRITPDKGYVVYRLKVDDANVKTARTYTFKNVRESHTIYARFLKNGSNAKTGDSFPMGIALGAVIFSAAALVAVIVIAKKKKKK